MMPRGACPGGAPMNVAIHLKRQGQYPLLVSSVGKDMEGVGLKNFLLLEGLDLSYLLEDNLLPTSKVLVHLDEWNNATYEICGPVAWDNIFMTEELEKLALKAGLIVFGTLASRNKTTRNTLLRLLEISTAVKLLDVNLRAPYDTKELVQMLLQKADFVKLNDEELKRIANWNGRIGKEDELLYWLSDHYNCPSVCLTRGANGATLLFEGRMYRHPGFKVTAVDTVGAGDAFQAALIAKLSEGCSPEKSLEYASATGAFVASRTGAVPFYNREDIESLL